MEVLSGGLVNNFNWLSGNFQRVQLGLVQQSSYLFSNLVIKGEINSVMNMKRADGVIVPQQFLTLNGSGRATAAVSTERIADGISLSCIAAACLRFVKSRYARGTFCPDE